MVDQPGGTQTELVRAERLVAGGAALSRREDGRIVLVDDALPGELVEVSISALRGVDRGSVVRIAEPSTDRITPVCPKVAAGCGGCDLATMAHTAQVDAKVAIVVDGFRRLGGWQEPVVRTGPPLDPWAFRTTLRLAVTKGRAGLHRAASNAVVTLDQCAIAHPLLAELLAEGFFGDATEVTLRVGAATGERLAMVTPDREDVLLPDDVRVVGIDELAAGKRSWIHDIVAGRRWRISAASFFQTRPDGAAALIDVVSGMFSGVIDSPLPADHANAGRPRTLLDAYSGVGLFAGSLLADRPGWRAVAVEHNRSAAADARVNLADFDARVVVTEVERFRVPCAELVVADPSRAGLGARGAAVLAGTDAERIVLVSCDPAAAGRDAGLLIGHGYVPSEAVVVDLFPHTHHTEVVTRFDRT